jgi:polynucleotide 5'-hydroxyl-kinase GRC3/NOL9
VDAEFRGLRSLHPERLYFVGSITPEGSLLRMVTGMGKILKYATSLSLDRLIIDTTGFIHGDSAVELKHQLIEIVSPDSIVAIQRGSECEPLIQPFDSTSKIYRVPVPRDVTQRSRVERRRRRLRAFQAYFKDSNQIHFPFSAIRVSGVTALQKILPYDAITHNYGVFKGMEEIAHIGGEDLRGLLVGLINGQGETLSIGIIEGVDSEKKELCIRSPLIDYLNVKRIHFSDYRLERAECV